MGRSDKVVCFIGGGYDENQDKKTVTTDDKRGRAIYVVDVQTRRSALEMGLQ